MLAEVFENWRDSEESLEAAVLEAMYEEEVGRRKKATFCMRIQTEGRRGDEFIRRY
jgi:hypothetical protein